MDSAWAPDDLMCVICRVSSSPMDCNHWELCVELEEGRHNVEVTKSGNVYTVSIRWPSVNK